MDLLTALGAALAAAHFGTPLAYCAEESIYQQPLWPIASRFNFLRRRTANTHNFTATSPRHLFDRLAEW
jgi:hypothetical protein